MKRIASKILLLIALVLSVPAATAQIEEESFKLVASDKYELDARVAFPDGHSDNEVSKVIILLHGSGPQSMDADFTAVTRDGKPNLFFKELSDTLATAGFAVIRYHKRSFQTNLALQSATGFKESEVYKTFAANPLLYFVDDAKDAVSWAENRFPEAEVFLLGHSQGAYIALQVAHQLPQVKGVGLIGFAISSLDVLLFEQTVYRPLSLFIDLDLDGDGFLSPEELAAETPVATSIRGQMSIIDLDGDASLSKMELQAGNLSNLLIRDVAGILREQEARYPRAAEILAGASFKAAFFQGMWDNQTPAYNTKAVELVSRFVWSKDSFRFFYFDGLGHALDKRDRYDDLQYNTLDQGAKNTIVRELSAFF